MNQPYPPQQPGWAGQTPPGYVTQASPPGWQPYPQPGQQPQGHGYPGGPQQSAGYGAPQPSGMVLTLKYHPLAFLLGLLTPVVVINGQRVRARWGRNELPTPPGQYHLHVHAPYLLPRQIGKADTVVPVSPGQIIDVEYRAPLWTFSPGSLGPVPQRYNGAGAMAAAFAAAFVLAFLLTLPALLV